MRRFALAEAAMLCIVSVASVFFTVGAVEVSTTILPAETTTTTVPTSSSTESSTSIYISDDGSTLLIPGSSTQEPSGLSTPAGSGSSSQEPAGSSSSEDPAGSSTSSPEPVGSSTSPEPAGSSTSSQEPAGSSASSEEPAGSSTPAGSVSSTQEQPALSTPAGSDGSFQEGSSSQEPAGSSTSSPEPAGSSTSSPEPAGSSTSSQEPAGSSTSSQEPAGSSTSSQEPAGSSSSTQEPAGSSTSSEGPAGSSTPAGSGSSTQEPSGLSTPAGSGSSSQEPAGSSTSQEPAGSSTSSQEPAGSSTSSQEPAGSSSSTQEPAGSSTSSEEPSGSNTPAGSSISTPESTGSSTSTQQPLGSSTTVKRDQILSCYQCLEEEPQTCYMLMTSTRCAHLDDVCFWTVKNYDGRLVVSKGCTGRPICDDIISNNNRWCEYGSVTEACTWCCEDRDNCNHRNITYSPTTAENFPSTTTTAVATTTTAEATCDWEDYSQCSLRVQELALTVVSRPAQVFEKFCSSLEAILKCLEIIEGCTACSLDPRVNATLLRAIVTKMAEYCPLPCDVTAARLCITEYHERIIVSLSRGVNCIEIGRIEYEQTQCLSRVSVNCNATTRELIYSSFEEIHAQVIVICRTPPTTIQPPPPTESPECEVDLAVKCIKELSIEIEKYYNKSADLAVVCAEISVKEECYIEASAHCSDPIRFGLEASFNVSRGLIAEKCVALTTPVCDTTRARNCILELYKVVEEAKDFETACRMINVTVTCVFTETVVCTLDEKVSLNKSLQIVINMIGERCDHIIDIWPPRNGSIDICEGDDDAILKYRLRNPPSSLCGKEPNCKVFVDIDIEGDEDGHSPKCRNGKVIAQAVIGGSTVSDTSSLANVLESREVTDVNWNVDQTVSIAARLDFQYDGDQTRQLTIWIHKEVSGEIVERRNVGNFTLKICDRDRPALCSSVNDPHITTFDKRYYNMFEEGFFVLYRHRSLPYEVQIATQRCNAKATCNCAAGVRSGDTVFFVDSCRKKGFVSKQCGKDRYNCHNLMKTSLYAHSAITPGTHIFSKNNGKEYIVRLPHGTVVKIVVNGKYLNIWITASPPDWRNSEGLCGYYDINPLNDFKLRDGTFVNDKKEVRGEQPRDFSNDWRVPDTDVIYTGVSANTYVPPIYCVRDVQKSNGKVSVTHCSYDALLETCDLDSSGEEIDMTFNNGPVANKPNNGKKHRRDTTAVQTGLDDFDVDPTFVPQAIVITEAQRKAALDNCTQYFQSVKVAELCINHGVADVNNSVDSCVEDLLVTGSGLWMATSLEALREQCMQELSRTPQQLEIAKSIQGVSCPNQCSDPNGKCVNGACQCTSGFSGNDCAFNLSAPIELVIPYNDGLCDMRKENCFRIQLTGVGFIPSVTSCTVQPVSVNSNGVSVTGETIALGPAKFVSPSEVHCTLDTLTSALVQVSNTKLSAKSSLSTNSSSLFIAYDSVCYKCHAASDTTPAYCIQLASGCVIDGACYGAGEENPADACLVCRPEKATAYFSRSDLCPDDNNNVGLIVGLVVGLTALCVLVAGITAYICIKKHTECMDVHRSKANRRTLENYDSSYHVAFDHPPVYSSKSCDVASPAHSSSF